jgi:hypothetical protein
MEVNGMDFEQASAVLVEANRIWDERSSHEWSVRISGELLERYPFLADITL